MRIVLVGNQRRGSLESALAFAGHQIGHDVVSVSWPPTLRFPVPIAIRWPGLTGTLKTAGENLLAQMENIGDADLMLVVKGPYIAPSVIRALKAQGMIVACWNADDPFDFEIANRGAGVRNAVSAYDHYVTWSPRVANSLARIVSSVHVAPFACDPESFRRSSLVTSAAGRITFVGTATRERVQWISAIADYRPLVFGSGWPRLDGVELKPPLYGEELCATISQADVNLNFLRPQNHGTHNMRTFEIPACQGHQFAEWSEDHSRMLPATGASLFRSVDELRELLSTRSDRTVTSATPDWIAANSYAARLSELLPRLMT